MEKVIETMELEIVSAITMAPLKDSRAYPMV
jgi:hypothetical protein